MKIIGQVIYVIGVLIVFFTLNSIGYNAITPQYWIVALGILVLDLGKDIIDRCRDGL
jgi:hypothetical protein